MTEAKTLLYAADCTALENDLLFSAALSAVSPERRKKAMGFRFDRDKRLSLGAELVLKKALADFGADTDSLRFIYGDNEKPYLAGSKNVFFNLSHSESYVLCAVSTEEIGCDIEKIKAFGDSLAKHIFSEKEYAYILSMPTDEEKNAAFFRLWTLRESYMKYTGLGLSLALSDFEITTENDPGVLLRGEKQDVYFGAFSDIPGYACAVCSPRPIQIEKPKVIELNSLLPRHG